MLTSATLEIAARRGQEKAHLGPAYSRGSACSLAQMQPAKRVRRQSSARLRRRGRVTLLMKQRYWNPIVDGSSHARKTLGCIDWASGGYHFELLELMNYGLKFTTWW